MVHAPVPIKKALQMPEAKKALDDEWDKLLRKGTWKLDAVREKGDVIEESRRKGKTAHFGTLMDLCHLKHAELAKEKTQIQRTSRF